ncbi:MAG: hypothetical protein R3A52_26410 [Polyangiales bacterium]
MTLPELRVTHAPWRSPEPAAIPALTVRGRRGMDLTAEVAQPVLASANEPVRACYRGFLAFSPEAAGAIMTRMRVNTDGSVSDVETIGHVDQSLSLAMVPCTVAAVRQRRFPDARRRWCPSPSCSGRATRPRCPTPPTSLRPTAASCG